MVSTKSANKSENRLVCEDGQHCSAAAFRRVIILLCVRWYLRYSLTYRDLEEIMAERNLSVDHVTIWLVAHAAHKNAALLKI
jgi:transposase-like protein